MENNKNNRFKMLISFIIFVLISSVSLTVLYSNKIEKNDIQDDETLHIPLEFNTSLSDNENVVKISNIVIDEFSTRYNDTINKWLFCMTVHNNNAETLNTKDNYIIKFYDENSNIINSIEEKFTFMIEADSQMMINVVLDFDGSLISSISIEKMK